MYDHLDDVDPPVPGEPERSWVGARARQRRQRRVALVSGSAAVVAAAALVGVAGLAGGSPSAQDNQLLTMVTPTLAPTPGPTTSGPRVTLSPAPGRTTTSTGGSSPTTARPPAGSRTPSSPTCVPSPSAPCSDGRPGWTGTDACAVWTAPLAPVAVPVTDALEARLAVPASTSSPSFSAALTFTNSGDEALQVRFSSYNLGLLLLRDGEFDAAYGDVRTLSVAAGESASVELTGSTRSCGDTPAQGRVSVPRGAHEVGARLRVSVDRVVDGGSGVPTLPVVTPSAGPAPTTVRLVTDEQVTLGGPVSFT